MLKVRYNDELLCFDDLDLEAMYEDEGAEGIVYRYGKDALKIYKDTCFRSRIGEADCIKLGTIATFRVLMPGNIIYDGDTDKFVGYATPYIYRFPAVRVMDMKVDRFVDELDVIGTDLKKLAYSGVEVADWHIDNMLFDGKKIFMGDPGGMEIKREIRGQRSFGNNLFVMNRFLKEDLFPLAQLSKKKKRNMESVFDDHEYMGDFIRDTALEKETVRQYVKRMTK